MPKIKTNRSLAKRIKLTKGGKAKRGKAGRGHLLTKKKSKRKRRLRKAGLVSKADLKTVKIMLPY